MAEPKLITICIAHYRDTDFVLNTLYCLRRLTKNPYQVFIRDNNSGFYYYDKLRRGAVPYDNMRIFRAPKNYRLRGSQANGESLNYLVDKINTRWGVIMHADCTFLLKGWDEVLIGQLGDRVKIVGTGTPLKGRQDFPFVYGVLFETGVMQRLKINWQPRLGPPWREAAWELKEKYVEAGYRGVVIPAQNTRHYKKGPFGSLVGVEEYYWGQGRSKLIASHFGRGSTLGSAKYQKGTSLVNFIYRLPVIGRLPRKWKGRKERNKWIKICQTIAKEQAT
ncbi:MAG: glycosyltransferase [bacterium]